MLMKLLLSGLVVVFSATSFAAEFEVQFVLASTAELDNPHDLKLAPDGKYLFVSDVGK